MECSNCTELAKFKCCTSIFLCQKDLISHIKIPKKHRIETLNKDLKEYELRIFKDELKLRIGKLDEAVRNIQIQKHSLLNCIEHLLNTAEKKLMGLASSYSVLFKQNLFTCSETKKIREVLETRLEIELSSIHELSEYIEKKFSNNAILHIESTDNNMLIDLERVKYEQFNREFDNQESRAIKNKSDVETRFNFLPI